MAGVGDVGTSSFEFYEGIRILIPGAMCVAAYGAVVGSLGLPLPLPQDKALAALLGALLAGLLLYYVDVPAKSAVYRTDLPSQRLDEWDLALPRQVTTPNAFFVLLDERMPSAIRNRALYMGSIFRIGYEAIVIMATCACGVLLTEAWPGGGTTAGKRASAANSSSVDDGQTLLVVVAGACVLATPMAGLLAALREQRRRAVARSDYGADSDDLPPTQPRATVAGTLEAVARFLDPQQRSVDWAGLWRRARGLRLSPRRAAAGVWAAIRFVGRTSRIPAGQVPLVDRLVLLAGLFSLAWYVLLGRLFSAALAAVVLPLAVFLVRSHRGHRIARVKPHREMAILPRLLLETAEYWRGAGSKRRRQDAPANTLALALALGSASAAAAVQGGGPSRLTLTALVAWAAAVVAVLALVMARGHEIRLRASYATQSAWLRMNREDLCTNYFGGGRTFASATQDGVPAPDAPGAEGGDPDKEAADSGQSEEQGSARMAPESQGPETGATPD